MDSEFVCALEAQACKKRPRIGLGLWKANQWLVASLKQASKYAELVLVGDTPPCGLESVPTEEPWKVLSRLLYKGEIDGAVRGNLPASKTMKAVSRQFGIKVRRLALLELPGWAFFLGPVGIDEGESVSDRLSLVLEGSRYLQKMGVSPRISVLSGGRMEDLGRAERVDRSLAEGEFIASRAREAGMKAAHRGILIEDCKGDDLIVAPDGVSGNLIFRTLMLLCSAKAYGAPVIMEKVFIDSSRARGDFNGPIMLASAMAEMKERGH